MNTMYTVVQSLYAYVYALDWVYVETIQLLKIPATTTNKNYHNTIQTYSFYNMILLWFMFIS